MADFSEKCSEDGIQVKPRKKFDWLSETNNENLTPFQQFVVNLDWASSPVGPISTWPQQLRQMVLIIMSDPAAAVVYWGEQNTLIYNQHYPQLIGSKHPAIQGQDPRVGFSEVWAPFEVLLSTQRETGEAVTGANALVVIHRYGFMEETYFNWKFNPIIGPEGWVVGSHATVFETTAEVLANRRLLAVQSLGRELSESSEIKELCMCPRSALRWVKFALNTPKKFLHTEFVPGTRIIRG